SLGMVLASVLLAVFHDRLHVSATVIFIAFAVLMFGVTAYLLLLVPEFLVRFLLWGLSHSVFRIHAAGEGHVPFRGPALLVSNHMSHLDCILINACIGRRIRFMIWKPYFEMKSVNWFLRRVDAIPVADGRRDAVEAIRAGRKSLLEGHVVCIFAEGAVTRT